MPVCGAQAGGRVLRVQTGLDRVASRDGRLLVQGLALGDAQLQCDEVDAEHGLRDGVFDLEASVHLQEMGRAVRDEELDGPGTPVVGGASGPHGHLPQRRLEFRRESWGGRLLDDLLMAPLERAVTGAERPHGAVRVGHDLHLDMPSTLDVRLDEHLTVPEGTQRLRARGGQLLVQIGQFTYDAHAAPATMRPLPSRGRAGLPP